MQYKLVIVIDCEDIDKLIDKGELFKWCLKHPSITKVRVIKVK